MGPDSPENLFERVECSGLQDADYPSAALKLAASQYIPQSLVDALAPLTPRCHPARPTPISSPQQQQQPLINKPANIVVKLSLSLFLSLSAVGRSCMCSRVQQQCVAIRTHARRSEFLINNSLSFLLSLSLSLSSPLCLSAFHFPIWWR